VSAFRRRRGGLVGTTVWTLAVSLGTALTILVVVALVVLIATAPNWLAR
jgi:hypothetical protein